MKKVIMYLNQFFGQIGAEDEANYQPTIFAEAIGPAVALNPLLKGGKITHTVICGDDYMNDHPEEALEKIGQYLEDLEFDLLVAGPSFLAGRYGVNSGRVCKYVQDRFNVTSFACMSEENPGADIYRKEVYILKGGKNAGHMRHDISNVAKFANKFLNGELILWADEEGYIGRGIRDTVVLSKDQTAAKRACDMLLKKLIGEPFETELPIEIQDRVPIAPPLTDSSTARIAFISTGGVVPIDNPDKITSASATRYGCYNISNLDKLEAGKWFSVHGGYICTTVNANPSVVAPIDTLKTLVKDGKIGYLHPYFYTTTGNQTNQREAVRMAKEIIKYLQEDHIDAVIFGST